jgi:glycosyltransferase involved in cell wall biosynthesis
MKTGTILHVIDTTGPGGAETVFTQLAYETQKRGWRSIALIRGKGWVASELERLGIQTIFKDCKGSLNISFLKALIHIVKTEKVDLIQSHLLGSNVYASIAGLITRKPVISTFHGFVDISNKERFRLAKFLLIKMGASKTVAVTDQIAEMLIQDTPLSKANVQVIANGVDTDFFVPKDGYQIKKDVFVLGCLGNVRKAKNYPLAIKVLRKLKDQGHAVKLSIAGDDTNQLAKDCKQLAMDLGVSEDTIWKGFISNAPEYLQSLDVFLLCSSSEGHPLALTQAMAVGLPIVTTACGVEKVISPGVSALVADNDSIDSVANNLIAFIKDEQLRARFGHAAAKEARDRWSLHAMLAEYISLYEAKVN